MNAVQRSKIIWITGAGRCGTNLVGMLADGHPEVNVFPLELRLIDHWMEIVRLVSEEGGQNLPGALLDHLFDLRYSGKLKALGFQLSHKEGAKSSTPVFDFLGYVDSLNRSLFPKPENTFLYQAPGTQLDIFSQLSNGTTADVRILIMMRDPVQNYLAWVNHCLQKGIGYRSPQHVAPHLGIHSFLHLSMLRVLKAFKAIKLFAGDERVTISKLEEFSSNKTERERVWQRLDISIHDSLEHLTRMEKPRESRSGIWRTDAIAPVADDLYEPRLTRKEFQAFEQCAALFQPYYANALKNVEVVSDEGAEEVFFARETACLINDRNAQDKRTLRIKSIYQTPRSFGGLVRWPLRAAEVLREDVLFYPQARIKRMNPSHVGLATDLDRIPELYNLTA